MDFEDSLRPVTYEDNLQADIEEISESLRVGEIDYRTSEWSAEQIAALVELIMPFQLEPVINADELWRLACKLGRLARKLDLTGSKETPGVMRHFYGTLAVADFVLNNGGKVHLLEGVTSDGFQAIADADILYSDETGTYQVDYTNCLEYDEHEIVILPNVGKYERKYGVINMKLAAGCQARVMSAGVPEGWFNFRAEVPIYRESPREDDFNTIDKIMNLTRQTHWDDAVETLNLYSEQVSQESKKVERMIEGPSVWIKKPVAESLVDMSGINSCDAAKVHELFMDEMMYYRAHHPDSVAKMDRFYCFDGYRMVNNQKTKRLVPLPPVQRGMHSGDPFERLGAINKELALRGECVLGLWKLIQNATKETTHATAVLDGGEFDYDYVKDCTVKRCCDKNGDLANAVKLSFYKSKSLLGYQELLKRLTPYDQSPKTHVQLEQELDEVWDRATLPSHGSRILDEVSVMLKDVMTENQVSDKMRGLMKRVMDEHGNNQLMTQLSQLQEVTLAIASGVRKCRAVHGRKGSTKEKRGKCSLVMSIESISDQCAVVVNNLGPLDQSRVTDVSYMVQGLFTPTHSYTYPTISGSTRMMSMSHTQLDWNCLLTHKALMWASSIYENYSATKLKGTTPRLPRLPLFMMFLNSNKFSQVAEQVRYLFVNGIGLSTGPADLFKKVSWYTPCRSMEKLYFSRMIKLTHTLSAAKALGVHRSLKVGTSTNIGGPEKENVKVISSQWNIAMPDDDRTPFNEQALVNSFYVCRAVTIQRYNKLVSEALVLDKQLEARGKYLDVKGLNLVSEARFMDVDNCHNLLDLFNKYGDDIPLSRPFSPSPIVNALGTVATSLKLRTSQDVTVGDTLSRVYNVGKEPWLMNISDVMNNRGSVRDKGVNGVARSGFVEQGGKKVKVGQNAKCYETILESIKMMIMGILPVMAISWLTLTTEMATFDTPAELSGLSTVMDKLWPLVYYFACNFAACISKMVHKDQLGAREIAVLNAAARVMCRFTENMARHVRDIEHNNGITVNLIERHDKHDHIVKALNSSNMSRKMARTVMYDSADCSKWGPSMMMHDLYQSVAIRVSEPTHRQIMRNCYSLFGNKVFKIPDEFYIHGSEYKGGKDIRAQVQEKLESMSPDVGSYENQVIYLEESMHQGICGVASSVMGSDVQNLSNYVTDRLLMRYKLKTTSFITSDDYSRVLTWESAEDAGIFHVGKLALALHYVVMYQSGIQRNLLKSILSAVFWEFNSEFFTPYGEIKADIKSRLAFIDFASQCDPYDVSLRPMNQAAEFLRSEGSLLGSCWIFLLNNHLAMIQNQSRRLWNKLGPGIYRVPLELGGLIKPDPLKAVVSSSVLPLLMNYEPHQDCDPSVTLSIMLDFQPQEPELVQVDENLQHVRVPSFSRSGVISLARRVPRHARQIQEFLMSLDPREFSDAVSHRVRGSLVLALMACAKRELATGWNDGSLMNYAMSQISRTSKQIRVQTSSRILTPGLYSRDEIHQLALDYNVRRDELVQERVDLVNASAWTEQWSQTLSILSRMRVTGLTPTPRHMKLEKFNEQYAPITFVDDKISAFDELYKPKALRGTSDLHPWLYIESKMLYQQRLSKISRRSELFRVALREMDLDQTHISQRLMISNFAGGCRLDYFMTRTHGSLHLPIVNLDTALKIPLDSVSAWRGLKADIFSPDILSHLQSKRVRVLDITKLCNAMMGADDRIMMEYSKTQQLLANLKAVSIANNLKLVVTPGLLATNFQERSYRGTSGVEVRQCPLLAPNGSVGRHFWSKNMKGPLKDVYYHDFVYTRGYAPISGHGDKDVVREPLDLTSVDEVEVEVKGMKGFTMMVQRHTQTILQVFSQMDLELTKVNIYTEMNIAQSHIISELGLVRYLDTTPKLHRELLDTVTGFRVSVGQAEDLNQEESDDNSGDDELPSEDSDDEYGSDSGLSELSDSSEPLWNTQGPGKETLDIDDVSDSSSEMSSEEDYGDLPASESGLVRPSSVQVTSLRVNGLTVIPRVKVLKARKATKSSVGFGYEMLLPFDPGVTWLVEKSGIHPLKALLARLERFPESESEWAKEYVLNCVASYPPVKAVLSSLVQAEAGVTGDADDDEWQH